MMITSARIDGCADHVNKKPDLIVKNSKSSVLGVVQAEAEIRGQ